jgi:hypothetical protein
MEKTRGKRIRERRDRKMEMERCTGIETKMWGHRQVETQIQRHKDV